MEHGRREGEGSVQDKEAHGDNGLAEVTHALAVAGRVVGGLGREGADPDDGEEGIDDDHGVGLGQLAGAGEPGRHDEVDPCRDREEALRGRGVSGLGW